MLRISCVNFVLIQRTACSLRGHDGVSDGQLCNSYRSRAGYSHEETHGNLFRYAVSLDVRFVPGSLAVDGVRALVWTLSAFTEVARLTADLLRPLPRWV